MARAVRAICQADMRCKVYIQLAHAARETYVCGRVLTVVRYFAKHFETQADGSWLCISPAELVTPRGRLYVAAGTRFAPGTSFMGVDIVAWLEAETRSIPGISDRVRAVFKERRSGNRNIGLTSLANNQF